MFIHGVFLRNRQMAFHELPLLLFQSVNEN